MNEQAATPETPTNVEKLRLLPWSIASEAMNSIFSQFTYWGPPFVLFFSELGLSNTEIGFLFSLLPFFGLIAIFVNPAVARFGYKRSYVRYYTLRKFITLFLLFVPWINIRFGGRYTLLYSTIIFVLFALSRSIAITAYFPWRQEYVPDSVRGKYAATNNIVSQLTGMAAVVFAGYIVGRSDDINRFLILIAIAVIVGLISAALVTRVPGGAPVQLTQAGSRLGETLSTLRDANFRYYLLGLGLVTFANAPESTFVPLFMRREAGLTESQTILLQTGVLIGGLASTYFWGWASDRYGSKPVIHSGLYLRLLLICGWLLIPRGSVATLPIALGLAALQGVTAISWVIGAGRLLYVSVVPPERKGEYMSVYYAVLGLFGGLSQLLGGRLVDLMSGLTGEFAGITLNPFMPLFAISLLLTTLGVWLFYRVSADNDFSVVEFASMFVHGNPFSALSSVARYHYARDERAALRATTKMGITRSRLAVEELLDALQDPRFNVRFEAIIAMARLEDDPRVSAALQEIAIGNELSLTAPAIWALSRMGAANAVGTLRRGLDADFYSIRAHCARALGTLNDVQSAPLLLERLQQAANPGVDIAYASALGNLKYEPAVPAILNLWDVAETQGQRFEIGLAFARILGDERQYVRLLRSVRADLGTTIAQALTPLKSEIAEQAGLLATLTGCIDAFAGQALDHGVELLVALIGQLDPETLKPAEWLVLEKCSILLGKPVDSALEVIVLVVDLLLTTRSRLAGSDRH
ncbi:MAG: MFS transporter [Anaerolineales bacterium]|nr:MFS transporter [Anaerolineales bacterium]MCB8959112.1 MFS transporter [Ardenticatenales bacterium]